MTEQLLQKLEEKVLNLLSELETLRSEAKQLRYENHSLKAEKTTSTDRLKELVIQLDALSWVPSQPLHANEHDISLEKQIYANA